MSTQINISKKITAKDETVVLTSDVNSINFTGTGITATTVGNDVTVTVPGSSGLTVGTTAIASGTDTRLIYQNAGVVSQSANLTFNGTALSVNNGSVIGTMNSNSFVSNDNLNLQSTQGAVYIQSQLNNNIRFIHSPLVTANISRYGLAIGFGATNSSALIDVKAAGALSTDLAFRVRNSVDNNNMFQINGRGEIEVRSNAVSVAQSRRLIIGGNNTDNAVDSTAYDEITMVGYTNINANFRATILGSSNTCNVQGGIPAVLVGYGNTSSSGGTMIFGRSNVGQAALILGGNNSANGHGGIVCVGFSNTISDPNGFPTLPMFMIGSSVTIPNSSTVNNCVFLSAGADFTAPYVTFKKNNILIGSLTPWTASFDNNSTGTFYTKNGTAPTTLAADTFGLYSSDIVAGNAAPHFRTENGAIVKIYQETTAVAAATFVVGAGTAVNDASTFDGYTLQQIVKALRNTGLLA